MDGLTETCKSCGPQLLDAEPSHAWGVDQLGAYAREQHQIIVDGEKPLVAVYWRLGQVLQLARKQFDRGQWSQFLKEQGIDKTRAAKARAIFRASATAALLEDMSVEEAYAKRLENRQPAFAAAAKRKANGRQARRKQPNFEDLLRDLDEGLPRLIKQIPRMPEWQATALLSALRETLEGLVRLRGLLQARAGMDAE